MTVFLIVMVFLGFGSTYGRQLVMGEEISGLGVVETAWVIHLHAVVFVGWMVFLLTQTALVARGRTRVHMVLGKYGGPALAIVLVGVGSLITYVQAEAAVSKGLVTWDDWPQILYLTRQSVADLLGFVVFLGLGLLYRKRPPAHKRYMVFATLFLVIAATARMGYLLGPWSLAIGTGIMIAPLLAYDLYTEQRICPATLIGTGLMGVRLVVAYAL
jgi:hypothetical protein